MPYTMLRYPIRDSRNASAKVPDLSAASPGAASPFLSSNILFASEMHSLVSLLLAGSNPASDKCVRICTALCSFMPVDVVHATLHHMINQH